MTTQSEKLCLICHPVAQDIIRNRTEEEKLQLRDLDYFQGDDWNLKHECIGRGTCPSCKTNRELVLLPHEQAQLGVVTNFSSCTRCRRQRGRYLIFVSKRL